MSKVFKMSTLALVIALGIQLPLLWFFREYGILFCIGLLFYDYVYRAVRALWPVEKEEWKDQYERIRQK